MLRAQGKQPVYFIYQTELTGDAANYAKNYVAHIPATLEPFVGRFLVRMPSQAVQSPPSKCESARNRAVSGVFGMRDPTGMRSAYRAEALRPIIS
jgi:hypothetical protein